MIKIGDIEKIRSLTIDEFDREYLKKNKPVIIQGALDNWPASQCWDLAYLNKKIGTVPVKFRENIACQGSDHLHPNLSVEDACIGTCEKPFAEFITLLQGLDEQERCRYFLSGDNLKFYSAANKNKVNELLRPIYDDFSTPEYIDDELRLAAFWVSLKGVRTWLHYDSSGNHNLNAQVIGSKRIQLFDPTEVTNLYMLPSSNFSAVNIGSPDFEQHPLAKKAQYIEGELETGDLIFFPGYWFHSFQHTGDFNVNVNFWFKNSLETVHPLSTRLALEKALFRHYGVNLRDAEKFLAKNPAMLETLHEVEKWLFSPRKTNQK